MAVQAALRKGALEIDDKGEMHLPKLEAMQHDFDPKQVRGVLYTAIGSVQFTDLIMEMDAATNISILLLGRKARSEQELVALYAA